MPGAELEAVRSGGDGGSGGVRAHSLGPKRHAAAIRLPCEALMLRWQEWLEGVGLSRYGSQSTQSADALGERGELAQGAHEIQLLQSGPRSEVLVLVFLGAGQVGEMSWTHLAWSQQRLLLKV